MNLKAMATIEEYQMLRQGDTVTAAVSGGADSVALLDFLCAQVKLGLNVRTCHLNHCLRGDESDRDEQLVRTMCSQYGVPLEVKRVDVRALAKASGQSLETAAREARYAFFAEAAERFQSKIATAHTLSDNAETVLLNLARGTGIAGLCGIPPVRGNIIRPLIACTRAEVESYCAAHGLCYVTDSTNLSNDYTRNHIRHNVIPQLSRVNENALGAIGRMTGSLRQDAQYLSQAAKTAAEKIARDGGYDCKALAELHPAIRSRIVAQMLSENGIERSAERIGLIEGMLPGGRKRVLQVGRREFVVVRDSVVRLERREPEKAGPIQPRQLRKSALDGMRVLLDDGKAVSFSVINCTEYEIFKNNRGLDLKNVVDYDKIKNDVFLRSRQAGDRMKPAGRNCTKPLKKLFNELSLEHRDARFLLADSVGVFFAEGVGIDERVKIDRGTKKVLSFHLTENNT